MKTIFRFKVDKDLCVPVMACIAMEPDIYILNDEGKAVIRNEINIDGIEKMLSKGEWVVLHASSEVYERVLKTAQACPVLAIIVEVRKKKKWVRAYPKEKKA